MLSMVSNIYCTKCITIAGVSSHCTVHTTTYFTDFLLIITENEIREMGKHLKGTLFSALVLRGNRSTLVSTFLGIPELKKLFDRADVKCQEMKTGTDGVNADESMEKSDSTYEAKEPEKGTDSEQQYPLRHNAMLFHKMHY